MYVEFEKNFSHADSSDLMAVTVISASWAQKRLIPTFYTWCTSSSWKIFFSPIRESYWRLDSFWPPEPKNVWFLLSTHDLHRVHEKFFSRRYERADGFYSHFGLLRKRFFSPIRASNWLLDSFCLLSLKTFHSHFLDMMYVDFMKNFLLADSNQLLAVRLILASWAPKTFDSYFLHMMYVEFEQNFSHADSSDLMAVIVISASWAQKRLISTFYTWCTFSSWKIFFSPIRASYFSVRLILAFWT